MIAVTQARENDRTTFCRQFTYNKNGYSNRETYGAVVSGIPVGGLPAPDLPIGSKISLTDPSKLSPGEVGYIVVEKESERLLLTPDVDKGKTSNWNNRVSASQAFISDMTEKAQSICTLVQGAMSTGQLGYTNYAGGEALAYFSGEPQTGDSAKRSIGDSYWTDTEYADNKSYAVSVTSSGAFTGISSATPKTATIKLRPLVSIPADTLVLPDPNAKGAYELA